MVSYHVLLVEDEEDIRKFVCKRLEHEGYQVSEAVNCRMAERLLQKEHFDLIVLDIMLPDGSGLEFCRNLRGITRVPVLFVTSLGEKSQVIQGLRAGADDYIVKPFDADELVARIEVQLRRLEQIQTEKPDACFGPLALDLKERRARWEGKDLVLSPKEFQILAVLCRNRNRFTTAEELYSEIWGMSAQEDVRTVKVHISGLRRKLRRMADEQMELVCRKERGYRLEFLTD